MSEHIVNSQEYWEERFESKNWNLNRGQEQTQYFYTIMTKLLPQWLITDIKLNQLKVFDFGCAEGQGMPLLTEKLGNNIIGVDFAPAAIENARAIYPQYHFEIGDIKNFSQSIDVAIMSNIIEHFCNPYEIIKNVARNVSRYLIIMVPFEEKNLMTEHEHEFTYDNLPITIDGFQLVHFEEYDCLQDQNGLFLGKQILLIYSKESLVNETLTIKQMDGILNAYHELTAQLDITSNSNADLSQQLNLTRQNNDNLMLQLAEAEKNIDALTSQKSDVNQKNEALLHDMDKILTKQAELIEQLDDMASKNNALKEQLQNTIYLHTLAQSDLQGYSDKYADAFANYSALLAEHENLKTTYTQLSEAYNTLVNSYTWKIGNAELQIAKKLRLLGPVQKCIDLKNNGIKNSRKKKEHQVNKFQNTAACLDELTDGTDDDEKIAEYIKIQSAVFQETIEKPLRNISLQLRDLLMIRKYKGIVVYPHAVKWEPIQRPQHFLRELANAGYICFFCENADFHEDIKEVYRNVFVVKNGETALLPILQNQFVILLITYYLQTLFAKYIPQKIIWFDILDRLDFFDGHGKKSNEVYNSLVKEADIVTYSADGLQEYVMQRPDAIKLPNGVNLNDFSADDNFVPAEMESIQASGNKIVGYYGAIESWFDVDAIRYLADHTPYEIVLIGKADGKIADSLKHERIHLLGRKDYKDLAAYARLFDVAVIPFLVNDLTNCVSPVKFFEFAALGIPTVSSDIREMRKFTNPLVQIYKTPAQMVEMVNAFCTGTYPVNGLKNIAFENTWAKRVEIILHKLRQNIRNLAALANINTSGSLALETVTFFKYDGTTYYSGGAERYLIDLDEVCRELNLKLRVYQYAEYDWVRFYNNLEVIGLGAKQSNPNLYTAELKNEMNDLFQRNTRNHTSVNLYSAFHLLQEKTHTPTIGISHGIFWDNENNHFINGIDFWNNNGEILRAAQNCDYMVSVDTNTCNWFQTIDYNLSRKIKYIPNYVDNKEFFPVPRENADRTVITYPRRLYGARGLYIVLDILDDILETFPNTEFRFVGKGFEEDTKYVEEKIAKWGDRVKWYSKSPDQMHEVYKETDISLVPTMYSEGTSLSCLEALSSGNVVICTRVGGLTDLIINGFNGLLIEPDSNSLKDALTNILSDPEKMQMLKNNAVSTALAFSKDIWKEKWKETLKKATKNSSTAPYISCQRCLIRLNGKSSLSEKVINCICRYLSDGYYVYVASDMKEYKQYSYKRIQFISKDEDLYFHPEVIIEENSIID